MMSSFPFGTKRERTTQPPIEKPFILRGDWARLVDGPEGYLDVFLGWLSQQEADELLEAALVDAEFEPRTFSVLKDKRRN